MTKNEWLAWLADEANMANYVRWKNDPVTRVVIEGIKLECVPHLLPIDRVDGNMGLAMHYKHVGEHQVLDRMLTLDAPSAQTLSMGDTDYDLRQSLVHAGYTEAEATQLMAAITQQEKDHA